MANNPAGNNGAEQAAEADAPNSKNIQQFYYECLGDRDWEEYKCNEHIFLKRNIGFAIYGAPNEENAFANSNISVSITGYSKKQNIHIDEILEVILRNNFLEDNSKILIRFIFICCELHNKKKSIAVEPVFVLKKCNTKELKGVVHENCLIVIDIHGRVYKSWELYLENNRLPKCTMVYPKSGKYKAEIINVENEELQVILESRESPACTIGNRILEGADTAGTVASVGVTATFLAAAIPGIVVAPALLAGAAIGGLAVGGYSVGRSIQTLVNRKQHEQSIGLDNSESRWCWLNTTVGVLGASTSAAAGLMTRAASQGTKISTTMRMAFNTMNVANLIGSGINLGCTGYNIIDKLINNESVSALEIFQFASSILFFHQSVVGFKTASTIISETQSSTLQNYEKSLRSNRHRKLFKKAQLEARRLQGDVAGNAEVISGIQNINDPDNFFAGLARINKDMNKQNARYTITSDGQIKINSNYIVDPMEFSTLNKNARSDVLRNLPARQATPAAGGVPKSGIPSSTFKSTLASVSEFSSSILLNPELIGKLAKEILSSKVDLETISALLSEFTTVVTRSIFDILVKLLDELSEFVQRDFSKLYPMVHIGVGVLQFIISHIRERARSFQIDFKDFLSTFFDHDGKINILQLQQLAREFRDWLKAKIESLKSSFGAETRATNVVKQLRNCDICNGYYYDISS
ncbi:pastrel [Carabus blaptoides fortunei]